MFGDFWERFWAFWNFEKKNFENFRKLDLPWSTGHKFFRKNHPKTRLDTFGNTFGHFWNFENIVCENFRKLGPPWNTGHKIFQKIFPKTCSKHVWILLGTLLGIFGILKIFFLKIFENSTLHGALGKKIFRKICPKTRSKHAWILSGTILGIFGILKKKILKIFENSTLHGTLGIKFFRKNQPITGLDTFGNTFGQFWNFENIFF